MIVRVLWIARYILLGTAALSFALLAIGLIFGSFGLVILAAYVWGLTALSALACVLLQAWLAFGFRPRKNSN